jgi:MoaD family protein
MPRVKLFASLRKAAGAKEVHATGGSLQEVLKALAQQHPALGTALLEKGEIRPHVVITLNGHPIADARASVTEDDEIAIFPPLAGG